MRYGRNTPMKIKPDSRQEKGWNDLTDSFYSLRKDIFHMIEKRIGPIFNVFCVGSPLHVKFAMSTLPFCLEHRQCYVVISDFKYSTDKSGNQYGGG